MQEIRRFIAEDGREFIISDDCKKYEQYIRVKNIIVDNFLQFKINMLKIDNFKEDLTEFIVANIEELSLAVDPDICLNCLKAKQE